LSDPLDVVAGEISDEAVLLCLDEFMVYFHIIFFLLAIDHRYFVVTA